MNHAFAFPAKAGPHFTDEGWKAELRKLAGYKRDETGLTKTCHDTGTVNCRTKGAELCTETVVHQSSRVPVGTGHMH